jgi:hypothetical protein
MTKKNTSSGSAAETVAAGLARGENGDSDEVELKAAEEGPADVSHKEAGDQPKASITDLLYIAREAVNIRPPLWVSSILGLPWTWIPPYRRYSEFRILDLWRLGRTISYLVNVSVPSIPRTPPPFSPPLVNYFFWQPSVILQRPDHNGNYTTFPEEAWFFLNGIMTDDFLAQINAANIAYLFHRPITLIQNSTDSFAIDLLQCMVGKEWAQVTEPVIKAFPVIYDALKDPHKEKVVVIAHSQGTIIIANVLRLLYEKARQAVEEELEALEAVFEYAGPEFVYPDEFDIELKEFDPLKREELAKLEVYCFATCANVVEHFPYAEGDQPVPWIEHFGNENDIVARLGMLAPNAMQREINIAGPRYIHRGAWGHFLNEHYLFGIEKHQKIGRQRGGAGSAEPFDLLNPSALAESEKPWPRLYDYINGGSPDA